MDVQFFLLKDNTSLDYFIWILVSPYLQRYSLNTTDFF